MTSTLTAISTVPGADGATRARPANARLAPGGQERGGEHDARVTQKAQTGEAARWQRILDLLDPSKRCGAWCPATFAGRPVVCTRAPSRRARAAFRRRNRLALVRRQVLKAIPHGSSNTPDHARISPHIGAGRAGPLATAVPPQSAGHVAGRCGPEPGNLRAVARWPVAVVGRADSAIWICGPPYKRHVM
jgi:hypothetical protein